MERSVCLTQLWCSELWDHESVIIFLLSVVSISSESVSVVWSRLTDSLFQTNMKEFMSRFWDLLSQSTLSQHLSVSKDFLKSVKSSALCCFSVRTGRDEPVFNIKAVFFCVSLILWCESQSFLLLLSKTICEIAVVFEMYVFHLQAFQPADEARHQAVFRRL